MKIRLGFVTNSSSSSFILSYTSVNDVFNVLKDYMLDAKRMMEVIISEADDRGICEFIEDYIDGDENIYSTGLGSYSMSEFGVDIAELAEVYKFIMKYAWILDADNYDEYEKLRAENCSGRDFDDGYPFTIVDHVKNKNEYSSILEYYKNELGVNASSLDELGKVGVYSRDCWLPKYLIESLKNISNYSCEHMG